MLSDQTHALRGLIGLAHGGYHDQEADGLLLAGKMDFLELLQFGGYRSMGLDYWYDFLNLVTVCRLSGLAIFLPPASWAAR